MTLAEARRILQAYRPGVDRADDPEVEAALGDAGGTVIRTIASGDWLTYIAGHG